MTVSIHPSRYPVLQEQFELPYFSQIKSFLLAEKQAGNTIYPAGANIFKAFDLTPFDKVKVVILGQDPYHGAGQAMGLSFSVPEGVALPPSLKNIYKELELEGFTSSLAGRVGEGQFQGIGSPLPPLSKGGKVGSPLTPLAKRGRASGDLTRWAEQGVLLLNSILTVRAGEAASHSKIGWQQFTDEVIRQIAMKKEGVVFMLWGNYAISKKQIIENARVSCGHPSAGRTIEGGRRGNEGEADLILTSVHPSPLSAYNGWFGCNHFRLCNEYLEKSGQPPIQW